MHWLSLAVGILAIIGLILGGLISVWHDLLMRGPLDVPLIGPEVRDAELDATDLEMSGRR